MYIVRFFNNLSNDHLEFCFDEVEKADEFISIARKAQCHRPLPWEHFKDGDERLDFKKGDDCMRWEVIWLPNLK